MASQRGKDLLKFDDGASYATVAGLRTKRISFNAQSVDITDSQSAGRWRELLAGRASSAPRSRRPASSRMRRPTNWCARPSSPAR